MKHIVNRVLRVLIATLLVSFLLPAGVARAQGGITDDEIREILRERIDVAKKSVGIVVGLVDDKGIRIVSYGKPNQKSVAMVNADSVFEIGSVTKVFTSILLAEMVERGEVSLNDPISKYLPKSVKTPTRAGKEITLLDLANQTSGLPRMPGNFAPKDGQNPYADYSVEQMYAFISGYTLTRDVGEKYEYSNLGVGLLGHILALRSGTDYETLVRTRISGPLKMDSTGIKLTPDMQARLATGHNPVRLPVPNWDLPTIAGAGALRSTVNDMLKFVAANMGLKKSPLLPAMQKTHQPQRETGVPDLEVGLGWHILKKFGAEIVWHNGGTGGYHSFIGFDPKRGKGVVVLSNSTNDTDDIARHLLESQYPLTKFEPPKERKAIKLEAKIFDAYVGEYQLAPNFVITILREGDQFFAKATGQGKLEIFAETESDFFITALDAQITFVKDDKGQVTHLVLHQNKVDQPAKKIK
ncbi:MAG TPA: serine hydrolase [Pyrinomonadaceae bacterium]|nr:serine hydrolase [Pyrinomonadaceae bacterium]